MELDVLTKAESPHIVEFFGAFHNQASVYLCLEYMDAGSIEHLYLTRGGLPEDVLAAVAFAVVSGMKFLYKELRIMHRGRGRYLGFSYIMFPPLSLDVKPSNILVNNRGEVKLCDFGISGYLVRSLARTHIGSMCYMAVFAMSSFILHLSLLRSLNVSLWKSLPNIRPRPMYGVLG